MKGAAPGPWGWGRMSVMVGSVTRDRYDELVKLGRDWVATMSSALARPRRQAEAVSATLAAA